MVIDKIKKLNNDEPSKKNTEAEDLLLGKWIKCESCKEILYMEDVHKNLSVCPNCGKHFRLSSRRRLEQVIDKGTFIETNTDLTTYDPLLFEGYTKKLDLLKQKTGINEAVRTGFGKINGIDVVIAVMDGNFLMGSMGCVVGEKITRVIFNKFT